MSKKLETSVDVRVVPEVYQTDDDIQNKTGEVSGVRYCIQRKRKSFLGFNFWDTYVEYSTEFHDICDTKPIYFGSVHAALEFARNNLQKELDEKISQIRVKSAQSICAPKEYTLELRVRG